MPARRWMTLIAAELSAARERAAAMLKGLGA
jgi:hypothetical protein